MEAGVTILVCPTNNFIIISMCFKNGWNCHPFFFTSSLLFTVCLSLIFSLCFSWVCYMCVDSVLSVKVNLECAIVNARGGGSLWWEIMHFPTTSWSSFIQQQIFNINYYHQTNRAPLPGNWIFLFCAIYTSIAIETTYLLYVQKYEGVLYERVYCTCCHSHLGWVDQVWISTTWCPWENILRSMRSEPS